MSSTRIKTFTVTAAFVLVLLAGVQPAAASDTQVVVSDVELSDDSPDTGEPVTVTATVENLDSSTTIQLTQVAVTGYPVETKQKARGLGAIGPGDSLSVPLTVSFDQAGDKHLRVHVRGVEYADGDREGGLHHVKYPFHLSVNEPSSAPAPTPPRIDVSAADAPAGETATAEVTVSNPSDSAVTDLVVEVEGENAELLDDSRISPRVQAYNTTEFEFRYTPTEQGEIELSATLGYDGGEVTDTVTAEASPAANGSDLDAEDDEDGGFGAGVFAASLLSALTAGSLLTRRFGP